MKQEKEWKLGSVVLQTPVSSGRVRWWYRVNGGLKTTLGVVTSEYTAQRDSYINKGPHGWGYYQENGNRGNNAPATDPYGVPFPESCSVVTVDLDADKGHLRFYVNGVDQGMAYVSSSIFVNEALDGCWRCARPHTHTHTHTHTLSLIHI